MDISAAIEAILFAAGESVPVARLSLVLGADEKEISLCAADLAEKYEREQRGVRILRLEDKLQMCSAPEYAAFIRAFCVSDKVSAANRPEIICRMVF